MCENRVVRRGAGEKSVTENLMSDTEHTSIIRIRMITSRRLGWSSHVTTMGEKKNTCEVIVGNPEGKPQFGRTKCRWNFNIEIVPEDVDWIPLDKDKDQPYAIVNLHVS
jgi:hypothetical protein